MLVIRSLVPLPFLKSAWTSGSSWFTLLKPGLENFEHYFTSVWDECSCATVWAFFGIAFLWDWNENWPLPVLWPLLSFPNLLAYWVQHFHSIIFQDLKQLNWNSITSTSFVHSDAKAHLTSHSWMLALGEWSHYCDYLGHEDLFMYSSYVYFCHLFLGSNNLYLTNNNLFSDF